MRVPDAGGISVSGHSVRRTQKSVRNAGAYSVRVALDSKARKALRKRGKLRAKVRVSFKAKNGRSASKTLKVTFKQPMAKRAKARKGGR